MSFVPTLDQVRVEWDKNTCVTWCPGEEETKTLKTDMDKEIGTLDQKPPPQWLGLLGVDNNNDEASPEEQKGLDVAESVAKWRLDCITQDLLGVRGFSRLPPRERNKIWPK